MASSASLIPLAPKNWWSVPLDQLFAALDSSPLGLSSSQRQLRQTSSSAPLSPFSQLCVVLVDGVWTEVDSQDVVPGDIIALLEGYKVEADCRLITDRPISVDTSSLTGESEPFTLSIDSGTDREEISPFESRRCALSSCMVVKGMGQAIAVLVKDVSFIGQIIDHDLLSMPTNRAPFGRAFRALENFGFIVLNPFSHIPLKSHFSTIVLDHTALFGADSADVRTAIAAMNADQIIVRTECETEEDARALLEPVLGDIAYIPIPTAPIVALCGTVERRSDAELELLHRMVDSGGFGLVATRHFDPRIRQMAHAVFTIALPGSNDLLVSHSDLLLSHAVDSEDALAVGLDAPSWVKSWEAGSCVKRVRWPREAIDGCAAVQIGSGLTKCREMALKKHCVVL